MKIAVILGSTRRGRAGEGVARWVVSQANAHEGVSFELVDLADFNLPLLEEPTVPAAANRAYETAETRAWGRVIDGYDAFVFVTPEYNHSVPAAFKNAVDVLGPEWANKAVGFVSYGADGGVRAVEHWRAVVANLRMHAVRAAVALYMFSDFTDGEFTPGERRSGELAGMLDQLVPLAEATAALRA